METSETEQIRLLWNNYIQTAEILLNTYYANQYDACNMATKIHKIFDKYGEDEGLVLKELQRQNEQAELYDLYKRHLHKLRKEYLQIRKKLKFPWSAVEEHYLCNIYYELETKCKNLRTNSKYMRRNKYARGVDPKLKEVEKGIDSIIRSIETRLTDRDPVIKGLFQVIIPELYEELYQFYEDHGIDEFKQHVKKIECIEGSGLCEMKNGKPKIIFLVDSIPAVVASQVKEILTTIVCENDDYKINSDNPYKIKCERAKFFTTQNKFEVGPEVNIQQFVKDLIQQARIDKDHNLTFDSILKTIIKFTVIPKKGTKTTGFGKNSLKEMRSLKKYKSIKKSLKQASFGKTLEQDIFIRIIDLATIFGILFVFGKYGKEIFTEFLNMWGESESYRNRDRSLLTSERRENERIYSAERQAERDLERQKSLEYLEKMQALSQQPKKSEPELESEGAISSFFKQTGLYTPRKTFLDYFSTPQYSASEFKSLPTISWKDTVAEKKRKKDEIRRLKGETFMGKEFRTEDFEKLISEFINRYNAIVYEDDLMNIRDCAIKFRTPGRELAKSTREIRDIPKTKAELEKERIDSLTARRQEQIAQAAERKANKEEEKARRDAKRAKSKDRKNRKLLIKAIKDILKKKEYKDCAEDIDLEKLEKTDVLKDYLDRITACRQRIIEASRENPSESVVEEFKKINREAKAAAKALDEKIKAEAQAAEAAEARRVAEAQAAEARRAAEAQAEARRAAEAAETRRVAEEKRRAAEAQAETRPRIDLSNLKDPLKHIKIKDWEPPRTEIPGGPDWPSKGIKGQTPIRILPLGTTSKDLQKPLKNWKQEQLIKKYNELVRKIKKEDIDCKLFDDSIIIETQDEKTLRHMISELHACMMDQEALKLSQTPRLRRQGERKHFGGQQMVPSRFGLKRRRKRTVRRRKK